MSSSEELIAAAQAAKGDEDRLDAADLAIEEALRAGWDVALVSRLLNDFWARSLDDLRPDRAQRYRALATAVGYLDISAESRARYTKSAMEPTAQWRSSFAEYWSARIALRVEKDTVSSLPDLGSDLQVRRMLLDDEENVDARAMLDVADRLLEGVRPDTRAAFRLHLDRAHALLMLSDGGELAGPVRAARRSLARAQRMHQARDARTRGGHDLLELLMLQTHPALGTDIASSSDAALALRLALDDAITAGESIEPIVVHAFQHFQRRQQTPETSTAAEAALLRRLVGLDIPEHIERTFLSALGANLWSQAHGDGRPALAEEGLAIGRRLHDRGHIDDDTFAAMLLRSAEILSDPEGVRALIGEAVALRPDPDPFDEWQRARALVHLAEIELSPSIAREAIEIVAVVASTDPDRSRAATAVRERAVVLLLTLGAPGALDDLGDLIRSAPTGVTPSLVVAYETERALAGGTLRSDDAARSLYRSSVSHYEIAVLAAIELMRSPSGAAFPLLHAAAADLPAFMADISDALAVTPWSATVASILAEWTVGSPHETRTEEKAMRLLEQAYATVDEPTELDAVRTTLAARLLARVERDRRATGDPGTTALLPSDDLDRAIHLLLPDRSRREALPSGLRQRLLSALNMRLEFHDELSHLRLLLLQDTVYDEDDLLLHRLGAARLYQALQAQLRVWGVVRSPFTPLADALERELDRAGPEVLERAQGLASRSAFAAAAGGQVALAAGIAERGQGLLAAKALQRLGRPTSGLHVDHGRLHGAWAEASMRLRRAVESSLPDLDSFGATAPSRPPTRVLERTEALVELSRSSPHLADLIAAEQRTRSDLEAAAGFVLADPDIATIVAHLHRRGAQLSYLIATSWGGSAVTVRRDGSIAVTDLPGLTDEACAEWHRTLVESRPTGSLREAVVRGPETQPDLVDADTVLAELADALRPLAYELSRRDDAVELVLTGSTGRLPVTAALQSTRDDDSWFEISTAASARLHIAAEARADLLRDADRITAITDPEMHMSDVLLPPLEYATREGERLAQRYGGSHHTGKRATAALARLALRERHRVLHFAVHGASDVDDPAQSRVYLAGGEGQAVDPLTAAEMSREVVATRLVYLGACWTGRPGERMPQEAIGFPTLLLQSGAGGVIAPLWPVEDGASFTFAGAFYRSWFDEGNSTARALADAMRTTRQRHPSTPTWAAFSLYGV